MDKILIVGAGPVGLTAAVELARLGKTIDIVDENSGHTQVSKALGINANSLQLLEASGVTPKLLDAGIEMQKFFIHSDDHKTHKLDLSRMENKYNFMLMLPQANTEEILENTLQELGVTVARNTKCTKLEELPSDKIKAELVKDNETYTREYDFVVGADGAHSIVRKVINAEFHGAPYPGKWHLVDLIMDCSLEQPAGHSFLYEDGYLLVVFPIGQNRYRIIVNSEDAFKFLPDSFTVKEIIWESQFTIHHRLTDRYRQGRIFLAGDAAHLHTPVGGRGMNLGIEDAVVLANLLDNGKWQNYHELRYPAGKKVVSETDKAYRMLSTKNKIGVFLRDKLLFPLLSLPAIQRKQMENMSGLN